jgi:hypothetical protein
MNDRKDLDLRRLGESLEFIKGFRDNRVNVFDPSFRSWKRRTHQSLSELFGEGHYRARGFLSLQFGEMQARVSMHPP